MSLDVKIRREPFSDVFDLVVIANGHSEQLDPDELRKWFKDRGGNVEKLEPVLDYCWNFPHWQTISIANPRPIKRLSLEPVLEPNVEDDSTS